MSRGNLKWTHGMSLPIPGGLSASPLPRLPQHLGRVFWVESSQSGIFVCLFQSHHKYFPTASLQAESPVAMGTCQTRYFPRVISSQQNFKRWKKGEGGKDKTPDMNPSSKRMAEDVRDSFCSLGKETCSCFMYNSFGEAVWTRGFTNW